MKTSKQLLTKPTDTIIMGNGIDILEYNIRETDLLTEKVIGCAIEVHRALGPGLLESTYEKCLIHELTSVGIPFIAQAPMTVRYKGIVIDCGYRLDILIENSLVVELKSVDTLLPIHQAQVLTYMKLNQTPTGLIVNFNVKLLKEGIRRLFLNPPLLSEEKRLNSRA